MNAANPAIEVGDLHVSYGGQQALRGMDLLVPAGSVLGLLGPNGAGKTTMVRVLATLLTPTSGRAAVVGYDVVRQPQEVRRRIGLAGQYAAVDDLLTGRQNLELIGRLQHLGRSTARRRATQLLEQFELTDSADRALSGYSGGMKRRLDLAACLVAMPSVLFVDEPTTGLDPPSRFALWRAVRRLVDDGVTVLLTTQYLEEADELADLVVVMTAGRTVAAGSPAELKSQVGGERVVVTAVDEASCAQAELAVRALGHLTPVVDQRRLTVTVEVADPLVDLEQVAARLRAQDVAVRGVAMRTPSLDEVFVHLTERTSGVPAAAGPEAVLAS